MCDQCTRYTESYDIPVKEGYNDEAEREAADRAVARAKMERSATYGIAPKFSER